METISLRFAENFAPADGTIEEHKKLLQKNGYVWYGKLGSSIADPVITSIFKSEEPRILLINSGKTDRWWAYVDQIQKSQPSLEDVPSYYHHLASKCKVWIRVIKFVKATPDVMSSCIVKSSQAPLSEVSAHSMSPYFIIEYKERKGTSE